MKVLFVASGNKKVGSVSSFVRTQYESLRAEGLDMLLYPVTGHGFRGYMHHLRRLHQIIRDEGVDIVHAHYSTCGILAWLAAFGLHTKVFVSILGSFPSKSAKLYRVRFFIKHIWAGALTKSRRTASQLGLDLPVVANGVNLEQFALVEQAEARKRVGFEAEKRYIVFVSNPVRIEKNWSLAQAAVEALNLRRRQNGEADAELVAVFDKPHDEVVDYMCAADCLLLTSLSEGSPNVIKEAMACNLPIATTDVGDVHERLDGLDGCYVAASYNPEELASLLDSALSFGNRTDDGEPLTYGRRTDGRQALIRQGLTTKQVARRLIEIYNNLK